MTNRGRPAEYRNAAEKQKAYRERKKADDQRIEQALDLLVEVEAQVEALRKSISREVQEGHKAEIYLADYGYAQFKVDGYYRYNLNPLTVRHLIRIGALVMVKRDWMGVLYALNEKDTAAPPSN